MKDNSKLDLIIRGGKVISVFSNEIIEGDIGIKNGLIVTLDASGLKAEEEIILKGEYIAPSFIDAHIHIESSMLNPRRFAEVVIPKGTGAVISDPHEIANVLGIDGISYMVSSSHSLPMDFYYTIPSCVPSTNFETSGATIKAKEIRKIYKIIGNSPALSEMMNFPGVIFKEREVLKKIEIAKKLNLRIDGHSPSLSGKDLDAYLSAGVESDHESTSEQEVKEKLNKGCFILAREGSASKNLKGCLKAYNHKNSFRFSIVSDDREIKTLLNEGHIDDSLRKAVSYGLAPIDALKLVTINPANFYNLKNKGAVAPGYFADIVILKDLKNFKPVYVFHRGKIVAKEGVLLQKIAPFEDKNVLSSVKVRDDFKNSLKFPENGDVRTIRVLEDQILTKEEIHNTSEIKEGKINYLAIIERHGKNGNIGIGFVTGFDLKKGAIASTVSHDSHNIVVVSRSVDEMVLAVNELKKIQGGIVALDSNSIESLPLRIAGLMSDDQPEEVYDSLLRLNKKAEELGCKLHSPFMTLSFIALPVIPELRLTDRGLFDVGKFDFVSLTL
jgi:adenine deaminase